MALIYNFFYNPFLDHQIYSHTDWHGIRWHLFRSSHSCPHPVQGVHLLGCDDCRSEIPALVVRRFVDCSDAIRERYRLAAGFVEWTSPAES